MQTTIRLVHAKYFPQSDQSKADLIRHVWNFIDMAFDNVQLDVQSGETESVASSDRRNINRHPDERKKHGHRTDLLSRSFKGEIECSEVGKKDDGEVGTKELRELGLKVPKMLKDQMCQLVRTCRDRRHQLVTIGFVMMGLKLRAVILDNPSTYVCRVDRISLLYFPSTEEMIGSDFGALLGLVSQIKQLVCSTIVALRAPPSVQTATQNLVAQIEHLPPCPASPKSNTCT